MGPVPRRIARAGEHTYFFYIYFFLHHLTQILTIFIFLGTDIKELALVNLKPVFSED